MIRELCCLSVNILDLGLVPSSFFLNSIYLCIYFWLHWFFVAGHWLSLAAVSKVYSSGNAQACHRGGFFSCVDGLGGVQAYLSRCMWNLLEPGIEPVSPALVGRLSPGPPGGSDLFLLGSHFLLFIPPGCTVPLFRTHKPLPVWLVTSAVVARKPRKPGLQSGHGHNPAVCPAASASFPSLRLPLPSCFRVLILTSQEPFVLKGTNDIRAVGT